MRLQQSSRRRRGRRTRRGLVQLPPSQGPRDDNGAEDDAVHVGSVDQLRREITHTAATSHRPRAGDGGPASCSTNFYMPSALLSALPAGDTSEETTLPMMCSTTARDLAARSRSWSGPGGSSCTLPRSISSMLLPFRCRLSRGERNT